MGLGCGNLVAIAANKQGVDMTPEMVKLARENAEKKWVYQC